MAEPKPVLKRPPGYTDPSTSVPIRPTQKPAIPRSQIPPSFHPKPKRRSCCCCCCCFCCSLIFFIIIILAITCTLFYFWFQPKVPTYHIQSIKTPRFNISVTPDGTFLDAVTDVRFEATNPNTKLDFYYDHTQVRITVEDDVEIGSAKIPDFNQVHKNTTVLKFETTVTHLLIDDEIGKRLKNQIQNKQMVVNVEVKTRFGLGLEKSKLTMMDAKVICENVSLKSVDGGDSPKCTINMLKWINIH